MSTKPKQPPAVPSPKEDRERAALRVRQLRLIAGGCRSAAEDAKTEDSELLTMAGWTIFTASKEGLLASALDLSQILDSHQQMALNRSTRKILHLELPPKQTIEQFLAAIVPRSISPPREAAILSSLQKLKSKFESHRDNDQDAFNPQLDALLELIETDKAKAAEAEIALNEAESASASPDKRTRWYQRDATPEELITQEQNQALVDSATPEEPPAE